MTIREFRVLVKDLSEKAKRKLEELNQEVNLKDIDDEYRAQYDAENIKKYEAYKTAIEELSASLIKMLDENKPVTIEEQEIMLGKMGETRKALREIKDVYSNLYAIYSPVLDSVDTVYARINTNSNMTLKNAIEETESSVVKVDSDPDSMGGNSSRRLMIKVKRPDGAEVDGFFTCDHKLFEYDNDGTIEALMQKAVEQHQDDVQLKSFVEAVKKSPYGVNGLLLSALSKSQEKNEKNEIRERLRDDRAMGVVGVYEFLKGFSVDSLRMLGIINNDISYELIKNNNNIQDLLKKIRGSFTENDIKSIANEKYQYSEFSRKGISANKGSSRAGRNYALSKVASLLGASDVIAKSTPLTVEYNGNHYKGYFMEKCDGVCFDDDIYKMSKSELGKLRDVGSEVMEQLAKIQVIDYICQNVDRHHGNFAFKVNKKGKATKVTGIDNDLSFGTKEMPADKSPQHGIPLNFLMVIPEEMAYIISKLDKETLMGALADTGLTKAEIEATGARFDVLKKHLESKASKDNSLKVGQIKIVPRDGWKKEKLDTLGGDSFTLHRDGVRRNPTLFEKTKYVKTEMEDLENYIWRNLAQYQQYRKMNLDRKTDAYKVYSEATGINLFSPEGLDEHKATLSNYLSRFVRTENRFQKVHSQYTEMKDVLEKLANENYPKDMSLAERMEFENNLMAAEKKVKEYIAYKTATKDNGYNGTTRLKEAKALAAYLKSYRESFAEAFKNKLENEMDSYYHEYLQERKVDMVANAIVRSLLNKHFDKKLSWDERQSIQSTEEQIRKNPAFENMLKAQKEEFAGQSAIDYYNQLAETEPAKVLEAYAEELKRLSEAAKNKEGEKKEKANDAVKKNDNANNGHAKKSGKAKNL
ncbi:MAG: hypothetical protein HUJ70_00585 [Pseudobutyrivibrio sp.]|nr:hypothetical protein [Pseudobutyrivibrio sp.]